MKKHSDESLSAKSVAPTNLNAPVNAHVRYIGFEGIDGGRRLRFRVKPSGRESLEVTFDVTDSAFIATSGISIQDAAPMAYEKLVELLATDDMLDSNELSLTGADIARYIDRHTSSQKRAGSIAA